MKEKIEENKDKIIEAQKQAVIDEVTALTIQLQFMKEDLEEKQKLAEKEKNKEQKQAKLESIAQQKMQKVHPTEDNIAYKTKYYNFLCEL